MSTVARMVTPRGKLQVPDIPGGLDDHIAASASIAAVWWTHVHAGVTLE